MRLLSATLRNYRVHRELQVNLDNPMVLIHGANESGKSTLVEAIHCALFLKANGTTSLHKSMQSTYGGTPEVELEFTAAGQRHHLHKEFKSGGKTVLTTAGQATLTGAEAESCLANLLKVNDSISGGGIEKKMRFRWGHLWVWQGVSSDSPLNTIEETEDRLRDKLQAQAGQNVMFSTTDDAVIKELEEWEKKTFGKNGKPLTGSDLAKLEKELESKQTAEQQARSNLETLHQAIRNYSDAEEDRIRHQGSLKQADEQLKQIRGKLQNVAEIREHLKQKEAERLSAEKSLQELTAKDKDIRQTRTRLSELKDTASPGQQGLAQQVQQVKNHEQELTAASREREESARQLDSCRRHSDALQAQLNYLKDKQQLTELKQQKERIDGLQQQLAELRLKLAPLEAFTPKSLAALRRKQTEASQARDRLETYALNVELLSSDPEVALDGQPLESGVARTLTHSAELRIGDHTRLRLTPGGAEDLRKAQEAADKADSAFRDALHQLAVQSLDEAETKLQQHQTLQQDFKTIESNLADTDPQTLKQRMDATAESLERNRSRRDNLLQNDAAETLSDNHRDIENHLSEAEAETEKAQGRQSQAVAKEKSARTILQQSSAELEKQRETQNQLQQEIRSLETELKVKQEGLGNDQQRAENLNALQAKYDQAQAAEKAEAQKLQALGAPQLELEQQRLETAIQTTRQQLEATNAKLHTASGQLHSNGNRDPEAELKQATASVQQIQQRLARAQHQAAVRNHLLQKLRDARQSTISALTRPLEEAVTPYLNHLFDGSSVQLEWCPQTSSLKSFSLARSPAQGGHYTFEELSHGTREQVALALRLAMAQLLASDYDNQLPIVLDDAFTHADQSRREKLKSLLYLASTQNLQILLLTCHPENYTNLGAHETRL